MAPLCANDSTEDTNLTPGHFNIGRPLKAPPCKEASNAKISSLKKWTLVNRPMQDLWKKWLWCYLQSRSRRTKWHKMSSNLKPGDIKFLKDETVRYRGL